MGQVIQCCPERGDFSHIRILIYSDFSETTMFQNADGTACDACTLTNVDSSHQGQRNREIISSDVVIKVLLCGSCLLQIYI